MVGAAQYKPVERMQCMLQLSFWQIIKFHINEQADPDKC
jgi:hypothetical protein